MARNRNGKNNESSSNGNRFSDKQKGRGSNGKSNVNNNRSNNIPEVLKKDIADFNWYKPIGTNVGTKGWIGSVPVVAAIKVQPTLGITNSPSSPTNQMARIMYNEIVRVNSTTCPYEPVDLQLAMLAVSELYKFTLWAGRFYKYLKMYSRFNRAIPDYFFEAEKADKSSFNKNATDYRSWFNNFILKCSTISLPGNLQFFKNIEDMFTGAFIDEDSERAQFTLFIPHAFYKYDEKGENGGQLLPIIPGYTRKASIADNVFASTPQHDNAWTNLGCPFISNSGYITVDDVMKIGDEMVEALLRSEDICRISADVYKAYGPEKLAQFTMLNEDDALPIYYSPDMNRMLENSILMGRPEIDTNTTATPSGDCVYAPPITQDPELNAGNLKFDIYGMKNMGPMNGPVQEYYGQDYIYNIHDDLDVTPDIMIDLARWTPTLVLASYGSDTNKTTVHVESCGTEILTEATILWADQSGWPHREYVKSSSITDINYSVASIIRLIATTQTFHYFPRVAPILTDAKSGVDYSIEMVSFDKYAVVPQKDIKQIHDTYLITQFQVPDYKYSIK